MTGHATRTEYSVCTTLLYLNIAPKKQPRRADPVAKLMSSHFFLTQTVAMAGKLASIKATSNAAQLQLKRWKKFLLSAMHTHRAMDPICWQSSVGHAKQGWNTPRKRELKWLHLEHLARWHPCKVLSDYRKDSTWTSSLRSQRDKAEPNWATRNRTQTRTSDTEPNRNPNIPKPCTPSCLLKRLWNRMCSNKWDHISSLGLLPSSTFERLSPWCQ